MEQVLADASKGPRIDLIWGIEGIAEALGQTKGQTYHLLRSGALPAKQIGSRWCASRKALERFFDEVAA